MATADRIREEEGWRAHVYKDSLGFDTIGYGFLVDSRRGGGMPKEVGEYWLALEMRKVTEGLAEQWPAFSAQPLDLQQALIEMAFQLGVAGVLGFRRMLEALERGDRVSAADESLASDWHEQTPKRAERIAARIRGI